MHTGLYPSHRSKKEREKYYGTDPQKNCAAFSAAKPVQMRERDSVQSTKHAQRHANCTAKQTASWVRLFHLHVCKLGDIQKFGGKLPPPCANRPRCKYLLIHKDQH